MEPSKTLDLVIIGGGPAGMSAALIAGRARLDAVVVNAEAPRNAVTKASHGFLTRDGIHPMEMLAIAKQQLEKYETVRYLVGAAREISRTDDGFIIELADGRRLSTARVLLATGYKDQPSSLGLEGIEEVYGKSVFPCPFCDGWEHRDQRLAVFGGESVEHFVPVVRVWSEDIVVFTNGAELRPEVVASFEARGISVVSDPVARLVSDDGGLVAVELRDGTRVEREAGFVADGFSVPATNFAQVLDVETHSNDWGMEVPKVDEAGKSSVPGVYLVGDARAGFGGLIAAAKDGATCVQHIVHEIAQERWTAPNRAISRAPRTTARSDRAGTR